MTHLLSSCVHFLWLFVVGNISQNQHHTTCNPLASSHQEASRPIRSYEYEKKQNSIQHPAFVTCERISSCDAALLIENAYLTNHTSSSSSSSSHHHKLLLITSDASRGANRYSGLAAILREITCVKNETDAHHGACQDRVTIATRRIHTVNARDISHSERAAVALGIRTALRYINPMDRQCVLILTDSSSALNFFCRNNDVSVVGNHDTSSIIMNDVHYKTMQSMLRETIDSNTGKEGGVRILMAKVKSNKFENDGFFDHEATDIIASAIKTLSNKQAGEIYIWDSSENTTSPSTVDKKGYEIMDDSATRRLWVPRLKRDDLAFLARSEDDQTMPRPKKTQVVIKRERGKRLERAKRRIQDEFGIQISNGIL